MKNLESKNKLNSSISFQKYYQAVHGIRDIKLIK